MREITDEIIKEAAQGDLAAFEEIYRATSTFVYNVAFRLVSNREDAQEVTQDVFVSVHKNLKNFRFESALKTWLYRITVNLALNLIKRRAKYRNQTVPYDDALEQEEDRRTGAGTTNAEIEEHMAEDNVTTLLNRLNPEQRACMVLRSLEGLSYQEIAASLDININTVRTRIKRAREKLLAFRNEERSHELSKR